MKESYKIIFDALSKAGFNQKLEDLQGKQLEFKFTPYSLNSKLSFRFDDFESFAEFLEHSDNEITEAKKGLIHSAFLELGLNPQEFFYVNFFEAGKEDEL